MRNPELEAAIRAAPDDLDAYEVYADWLLEHGEEAHGELILFAVRRQREGPTNDLAVILAEGRILKDRPRIFGPFGQMSRERIEHDLALGFLQAVRIYSTGEEAGLALRHAVTHRIGAFLRALSFQSKRKIEGVCVNEDRKTTMPIWEVIFELGLPRTLRSIAVPLLVDRMGEQCAALAHVPDCTFPIRSVAALAPHLGELPGLRTIRFTANERAPHLVLDALLDHAAAFKHLERIVLSVMPAYQYDVKPLREALPQLELGFHI